MTAVEWLIDEIDMQFPHINIRWKQVMIEQALEMEKQQIEKMYSDEEVIDLLAKFRRENRGKDSILFKDIQEWFKKIKNKKL